MSTQYTPGLDLLNDIRAALQPMGTLQAGAFLALERTLVAQAARVAFLERALATSEGYMLNAKIDLETGKSKAAAIQTIDGGLKAVRG